MSDSSLSARSSFDSLRESSPTPSTLAPAVTGPMVWEGAELKDYVLWLTSAEVDAIKAAVIHFKRMSFDMSYPGNGNCH